MPVWRRKKVPKWEALVKPNLTAICLIVKLGLHNSCFDSLTIDSLIIVLADLPVIIWHTDEKYLGEIFSSLAKSFTIRILCSGDFSKWINCLNILK